MITGLETVLVLVTFFGWPDNDPPDSAAICCPQVHQQATEDTGAFDHPITLAAGKGSYPPGTLFYIPRLAKYAIVEDVCGACNDARIDLYMGPSQTMNNEEKAALKKCQWGMTVGKPEYVVIHPPEGLPVIDKPLANPCVLR